MLNTISSVGSILYRMLMMMVKEIYDLNLNLGTTFGF